MDRGDVCIHRGNKLLMCAEVKKEGILDDFFFTMC